MECAYTIEEIYSDNGAEYKGNPEQHAFAKLCIKNNINQRFTKAKCQGPMASPKELLELL